MANANPTNTSDAIRNINRYWEKRNRIISNKVAIRRAVIKNCLPRFIYGLPGADHESKVLASYWLRFSWWMLFGFSGAVSILLL